MTWLARTLSGTSAEIFFPAMSLNGSSGLYGPVPSAVTSIGTGNFTFDTYVYPTSIPGTTQLIGCWDNATSRKFQVVYTSSLVGINFDNGGTAVNASYALSLSRWTHIAVVRNSGAINIYIDGISKSSGTYSLTIASSAALAVGFNNDTAGGPTWFVSGFMKSTRISNTARWTSNFQRPTPDLTLDGNTAVLLNYDGSNGSIIFTDSAGNYSPVIWNASVIVNPSPVFPII